MGEAVVQRGVVAGDGSRVARPPIEHVPSRRPQIGDYATQRRTFTWEEARTGSTASRTVGSTSPTRPSTGMRTGRSPTPSRCASSAAPIRRARRMPRWPARATLPPSRCACWASSGATGSAPSCRAPPRSTSPPSAPSRPARCTAPPSGWTRCGRDCARPRQGSRHRPGVLLAQDRAGASGPADLESVLLVAPTRRRGRRPGRGHGCRRRQARPPGLHHRRHLARRPGAPALPASTTGRPKGAVHVRGRRGAPRDRSLLPRPRPGDIYWCTADPGWVTGTSYGIFGPLSCGATVVTDSADFDAERWYSILGRSASRCSTAPTALRC